MHKIFFQGRRDIKLKLASGRKELDGLDSLVRSLWA